MRYRFSIFLLTALALVVVATGCTGGGNSNDGEAGDSTQQPEKGKTPKGVATQSKEVSGEQASGQAEKVSLSWCSGTRPSSSSRWTARMLVSKISRKGSR